MAGLGTEIELDLGWEISYGICTVALYIAISEGIKHLRNNVR